MKKIIILLVIAFLSFSCSSIMDFLKIKTEQKTLIVNGNNGLSYEKAIVITEKDEHKGMNAEYRWLRKKYPGYKMNDESINFYQNKPYDIKSITTKNGKKMKIYFDISSFFGNLLY